MLVSRLSRNLKRFLIVTLSLMVLISGLGAALKTSGKAEAANAAGFYPGRIIDDGKFTNKNAMSVQDIQNFLNSKVPVCDRWHDSGGPYYCLKEYIENGKSSSQIIWEAAQAYGINPQVLIVTLQKENGLVTDTWPYSWQYRTAMGFGCPDGAPCDSQWFGFTNQVNQAARHFRNFFDNNPNWYIPYTPGVRYIRWSPNGSCGGGNVNIENRATAALYSYTPYQPNAAAMANLYGTGDGCSAYGNRNFWRDFTDWFGSPWDAPYAWSVETQQYDRDINSLPRGEKANLVLRARNIGTATWTNTGDSPVRLATWEPPDRGSNFYTTSWVRSSRLATLAESSVATGQVGTFYFVIQAGPPPGLYHERLNLVAENITWFNDAGQYFPIRVVGASLLGTVTQNTYPSTLAANIAGSANVKVRNDGNVTWYNTGKFTPDIYTYPYARQSQFVNNWLTPTSPTRLAESAVPPGQVGTFNYQLKAPTTNGNYNEQFQLGMTNLGWFNLVFSQPISVTGGQVITKLPVYRHYSPNKGSHFYTLDQAESNRIRSQGWNYEGVAFFVPANSTTVPVYRHYNPSVGKHFYTTDLSESQRIRAQGWSYEGIAWYGSTDSTTVPVYRHYFPNGAHFYTTDLSESQRIRAQGWAFEGVSWFGQP